MISAAAWKHLTLNSDGHKLSACMYGHTSKVTRVCLRTKFAVLLTQTDIKKKRNEMEKNRSMAMGVRRKKS